RSKLNSQHSDSVYTLGAVRGGLLNPEATNPDATLAPTEPIPGAEPSVVGKIFIGKAGLRAGWSLLIFIALLAAVLIAANFVAHKIHPNNPNAAKNMSEISLKAAFINESLLLFIVLFVTWIMSKIERRPNSVYGFGGSRKVAHFFAGLAWGVVCLSLLVLSLWKTGLLVIDGRLLFGSDILRYGAAWLLGFLLVGLFEEYFSRGKNPGESPIGMLSAGLVGMVFCFSLWRTGSLWWAIGFHTAWDWSQSFL